MLGGRAARASEVHAVPREGRAKTEGEEGGVSAGDMWCTCGQFRNRRPCADDCQWPRILRRAMTGQILLGDGRRVEPMHIADDVRINRERINELGVECLLDIERRGR